MKLNLKDIINKHKSKPCIVAMHGPSLNKDIATIEELQKSKGYIRFSVNEWYDFFKTRPDYWVVSNSEFTINNSAYPNWSWDKYHKWPKHVFNKYEIPLFYNNTADLSEASFVDSYLKGDYYPFDSRHFKGMNCKQILNTFRKHYEEKKDFNFTEYGNNSVMWKPRSVKGTRCSPAYAGIGHGWSRDESCCHKIDNNNQTIQEVLQSYSGHNQHLGPGVTTGTFAITFAILMGCNPIYVSGLDLDYSKGYANIISEKDNEIDLSPHVGSWSVVMKDSVLSDLKILKESAELAGTEIINLNSTSWHKVFKVGKLI
jgi:hypothetical protein